MASSSGFGEDESVAYRLYRSNWLPLASNTESKDAESPQRVKGSSSQLGGENVPRVVFIHVGSVVVLATGKTTTTWMLSVLSYTTVTGRHMAAAEDFQVSPCPLKRILMRNASSVAPSDRVEEEAGGSRLADVETRSSQKRISSRRCFDERLDSSSGLRTAESRIFGVVRKYRRGILTAFSSSSVS